MAAGIRPRSRVTCYDRRGGGRGGQHPAGAGPRSTKAVEAYTKTVAADTAGGGKGDSGARLAAVSAKCGSITYEAGCFAAIEMALAAPQAMSAEEQAALRTSLADVVGKNPNQADCIREMATPSGLGSL